MIIERFEWDQHKSDTLFRLRGFDLEFASRMFEADTIEFEDRRQDYGERRVVAVGRVDKVHLTVVYTDRAATQDRVVRRLITAWRSNPRERVRYEAAIRTGTVESGTGEPGMAS